MTQEAKCGCWVSTSRVAPTIVKCEPCRTALARAEKAEALVAQLRDALKRSHSALEALFAMVEGEVPSLLEDNHHFGLCRDAILAGSAALAAVEQKEPR
jgi:hypothetical protein